MSLLGTYSDSLALAATSTVALPKPAPQPRLSLWGLTTAAPKGVAAAGAERVGFASDVLGAFGQVLGAYPEAMGASVTGEQRKQADEARKKLLTEGMDFSSEAGDLFRGVAREYRPDAKTASTAENVVFGLTRGLAKIAGDVVTLGPAGAVLSGLDEATMVADDLKQEGVPLGARSAAGAVQGAFMAGGAVLPMAGQTLKATAALYLAGGPAGFVAQQAITRHILENAGQDKAAAQFDPFDPVGLAVASIIPLPFAHYGLKANRAAQAEAFRAGPVPSEPTPLANRIAEAYAPEHVDAARVLQLVEQRRSTNVGDSADLPAMARHEAALAKAEEQIAAGERVSVADEAPWLNAEQPLQERIATAQDAPAYVRAGVDGEPGAPSADVSAPPDGGTQGVVDEANGGRAAVQEPESSAAKQAGSPAPDAPTVPERVSSFASAVDQLRAARSPELARAEPAKPTRGRTSPTDAIELRKQQSVLTRLLECLNE